jgi:hypothetical protein
MNLLWYTVLDKVQDGDGLQPQKIPLILYRTAGSEPVREWLKGLNVAERQAIGKDLLGAQWRWPVGMPLCRPMGGGLWEVRRTCRRNGRRGCCFAFTASTWSRCTGSSRRRGPRRMRIWQLRESARRSWSDEREAYGFQHR